MATITLKLTQRPWTAYLSLAKPRAIFPHLITAAAAMFLAVKGTPPPLTLFYTLLGGGCVAAAANTFNSYFDRDIDALIARTCQRPLPSGHVRPGYALAFGLGLGLAGVLILNAMVNRTAALLAAAALVYYVLPYTIWLKRRTYWSAVISSGIGAMPPLIGWVAVKQGIGLTPLLLAAIIALWTLPHFWTLAAFRREDYARAGLKMLPEKGVNIWITGCAVLLVITTLLLVPAAGMGFIYAGTAGCLGAGFLYLALRMNFKGSSGAARRLYVYSIFYIAALYGMMIIDRIVFQI